MNKHIHSKDNPWFKRLKLLSVDNTAYRVQQRLWIEGDHLCRAAIDRGLKFSQLVFVDTVDPSVVAQWQAHSEEIIVVPQSLMESLSSLPSHSWVGGVLGLSQPSNLSRSMNTLVLDGVQDPGNAGAILRSAAAFGFKQVVTAKGSVALWSGKVIRAGMGAHFGLSIFESMDISNLLELNLPVYVTSSHQGRWLHELCATQSLEIPCMWVMGHEGQGISDAWMSANVQSVRIVQPGGEESLNVAAAAAICMHATVTQMPTRE